jgi:hypothetical protein
MIYLIDSQQEEKRPSPSRRNFLKGIGAAALASTIPLKAFSAAGPGVGQTVNNVSAPSTTRRERAFQLRVQAAQEEREVPIPDHSNNGDESLYQNLIGSFSKGLPHDSNGEVDPRAYSALFAACVTGAPADFDAIPMGGNTPLIDPQAGAAFDLEGTDSHQLSIPPAPPLASAWRAGEAVEVYWQAILRDVPFSEYATDSNAQDAIAEINNLTEFRGPRDPATNTVTAQTLFRGFTAGDLAGPYISQFLYYTVEFGAAEVVQRFLTYLPLNKGGHDYLTTFDSWLHCQNGQGAFAANDYDPVRRYIRTGRDIGAYVHVDVLFEAYFNACLYLIDSGAPLNPGNPYVDSPNQTGFGTFGPPHIKALLAEAATRALKAVWYQKWFVHRVLRPEAFGGLVHLTLAGTRDYPLHPDILNSQAVKRVFIRNGTGLLPHEFPEGCPQHPSYGQGHATVAGACATMVKAFFDDRFVLPNPVVPNSDGTALLPYTGPDAGALTVGGEMNKLASNIGIGRDHAAVHWRSDYQEALLLGEQVAISILRDQKRTYDEAFAGFTFTRFDGTQITV